MLIQKNAEPFLLPAGKKGILMIHGYTGSPSEMRPLANYLHERGFSVLAVRLPGHGTTIEDLNTKTHQDWFNAVQDGYYILKDLCDSISVVGLSMGGLLTIKIARFFDIEKIALLSTPIKIRDKRLPLVPIAKQFVKYIKRNKRQYSGIVENVSYDYYALDALDSMLELLNEVKEYLPLVRCPALIMQSRAERTVKAISAQYIYDNIASEKKELIWLEKSGHVIVLDSEKEFVFEKVFSFLKENFNE